jgi:succinate-semialdehyde dehydrogenase/glutarate-semialdehyde dehydrogenase
VFELADAPPGLVQVVQGEREVAEALVAAPGVDKVVFTGSTEAGRSVAAAAAERLCPVTLELSGKDAMLVFGDADLERALDGALWGAFANCGQICTSVERIYVERALHAEFVERLAARARGLRIGEELGPLVSHAQRAWVEELVESARERVVTGGARPQLDLPGWFYEPTVINGTSERLEREEIFGPVVTVEPFDGEDGAVARANASRFGLGASVWTRDAARARRVAERLDAGMVWVNDVSYSYAAGQTPWGGTKESGFGRTHSRHGLYECVRVKYADADRGRVRVPWWFPYSDGAVEGFRTMLDLFHGDGVRSLRRHRNGVRWLARRYLGR